MRPSVAAVVVVVAALAGVARAQPGMYTDEPIAPPGMTPPAADRDDPPAQPAPPPAPAVTPLDDVAAHDAAADRSFALSTAIALPSGAVDASLRIAPFGGIASVAAGLGRGVEVSADIGGIANETSSYGGGLKLQIARHATWAAAVTAGIHALKQSDYDYMSEEAMLTGGLVVTGCMDRSCGLVATIGGGFARITDSSSDTVVYATGAAVAGHGGLRAIGEGAIMGTREDHALLGFGGLRLGGGHVAVDVGVGFVVESGGSGGLPMASLCVRP